MHTCHIERAVGTVLALLFLIVAVQTGSVQAQEQGSFGTGEATVGEGTVTPTDEEETGTLPDPEELDKILEGVNLAPEIPEDAIQETGEPPAPGTETTFGGTPLSPEELDKLLDRVNLAPELKNSGVGENVPIDVGTQTTVQVRRLGGETIPVGVSILGSVASEEGTALGRIGILESEDVFAEYSGELVVEESKLLMETSGGKRQVNILPAEAIAASETPNRELVTKLELKEEAQTPVYTVSGESPAKLFGIFSMRMKIETKVSAETGQVLKTKKPWWRFFTW